MARHKNMDWHLSEGTRYSDGSTRHSWQEIHSALLMDIRDELQTLNRLLGCHNFVRIPTVLDGIRANTRKPLKKKKPQPKP